MLRSFFVALCLLYLASMVGATDLPTTISAGTILTATGNPYHIVGDTTIPAGVTLTLKPGVQITATGDYRLFVNGTLTGTGTGTSRILLRGKTLTDRGGWEGLYVSGTGHCTLTQATIENGVTNLMSAGGSVTLSQCLLALASQNSLFAWNSAPVQLTSCQFYSNTQHGVCFEGYQVHGQISGCDFRSNGGYPIRMKAMLVKMLGAGNTYSSNGTQRISVSCSLTNDIVSSDVWTRQAIPFELGAEETGQALQIASGAKLTIPAGTTLLADRIDCRGRLLMTGTATSRCLLQPRTPGVGGWGGLTLYSGSNASLTYVTLSGATTGITADDATLLLTNSTVTGCQYDGLRLTGTTALTLQGDTISAQGRNGLRLEGPSLTGSVSACRFLSNKSYPVWAVARNVALLGTGNTYAGNMPQMIAVSCGANPDLSGKVYTWTRQGVALDLTVSATDTVLNIATTATLNLGPSQTLYLGGMLVQGTLNVNGSSSALVNFRAAPGVTTAGSWNGLEFNGGGGLLNGVSVKYAKTAVNLTNASPTLTACQLCNSQYDGLACAGTSAPLVTGSLLKSNGRYGVYVNSSVAPRLGDLTTRTTTDDGGNTLSGNGAFEVYNATAQTIHAQNNTWASTNAATIALHIFDHTDDATRGTVIFAPLHVTAAPGMAPSLFVTALSGRATAAGADISWLQSAPAMVDLTVLNLAGRPVATVCRAKEVAAGTARFAWPGRTSYSTPAARGTYLAVLDVSSLEGTRRRIVTTFQLR